MPRHGTRPLGVCLLALVAGAARADEPRLTLVRPVRLIASDRFDPHYRERDASGADRRAEAASEAFAAGMAAAFGTRVVVPESGSSESRAEEGALFVRAQVSRAEVNAVRLATYAMGQRRNFVLTTTGGVEVLDLVSGEVYESRLFTVYRIKDKIGELTAEDDAALEAMFRENVRDLFTELGRQLAAGYAPGTMRAAVVDRLGPARLVIDRGREAGLSVGESFRQGRSVYLVRELFDRFAVVESASVEGAPLETGSEVSRIGFNTLRAGGQTRYMVLDATLATGPLIEARSGIDGQQLVQWTHDALRQEARLCVLPYGSIFPEQESAVLRTGLRALEVEGRRVYPDVFVRVVVTRADIEWRPAGAISGTLVFNVRIDLYFLDRLSGLVLGGAWKSGSRVEQEVAGERHVDPQSTFVLLAKETLLALCREVKAPPTVAARPWPVLERTTEGDVRLETGGAIIAPGATMEVFRPVKQIRDGQGKELGEYAERVGVVRVAPGGLARVLAERPGGVVPGSVAVLRSSEAQSAVAASGLTVGSDGGSSGDQALWLLLSGMVRGRAPMAAPDGDAATFLRKRGSFETGEFTLRRTRLDAPEVLAPERRIAVSARSRTENVTERGFDLVGGLVAEFAGAPDGKLKQGIRKTYAMAKSAEGHGIREVMEANSRWLGASILEEAAVEMARRIVAPQP